MLRLLKRVAWLGVLAAGLPSAQAFSTGGVFETWQVRDLGYNIGERGDIMGPMNIGEDYRRNTPVLTYAFDENFLDYFGSNGVAAVDQAFAILNNLKPVSTYSADLSEIPLEARRFNQTAGALNLIDLKSATLAILVEEMGLADPIRYTWTLHDRVAGANCPVGNQYLVTKRNFGIVPSNLDQLQYSSYVNGVLFSYYIQEYCANPPFGSGLSEAIEIPVDVPINAARYTPVASAQLNTLAPGAFYTGLTRDDVAGLRYLLRSGHVHWEDVPANSAALVPSNAPSLLVTSNLTLLADQSLTNDDAGLTALYPGLVIVPGSTSTSFSNVATPTLSGYYTNSPFDPAGTPPHLVITTNYTTNVVAIYSRSFANVVTNSYLPVGFVTTIDSNLVVQPFAPPGVFQTNTTTKTFLTNMVSGDFYLIPPDLCGFQILSNVLTTAIAITNSSTLIVTNVPTNAISGTYLLSRTTLTWFTNHTLAYSAVQCVTNEPGLRRGIEKITFVKTAYDSLLGKFYAPQTNYFTMTTVTNSTNWVQTFQRVVTAPDILFTAVDMLPGPAAAPIWFNAARTINFNAANALPGLAGPGTIDPPTTITFNKAGPIFYNDVTNNLWSLDELSSVQDTMWASYDDSTNAPVVYPNGTSIAAIESQMLMQVTSVALPPARVGVAYTTQLTGTGGVLPYTWSLAPNSPTPPSWLGVMAVPSNGQLSGTPQASDVGTSSFFVQMTGANGGFTVWQVALTVLP
jgi:hypothetical protein